ncbi:hypothetical protein [Sphingosinicella sp.]|uniref:hypothetical protein n=1 Tax=Sphingosinicella sp. TaxID=1917971 RepID=UPI0040379B0A
MKRLLLTSVAALAAASLSACNVQVTPPQNTTSAAPAAPAAPAQPAAPGQPAPSGNPPPSAEVLPGQARQNFTVNNQTGHIVVTLNVSASNDNNWGPDILGAQILQNGQSAEVTFGRNESSCLWDIRATYDDGGTTDVRQVNLCEVATVNLIPG